MSCYDNTISLYDVDGTRLQFTSLHNAKAKRYWQSTAQGLAVAKHDCHCALFATDPAHKVNELPVKSNKYNDISDLNSQSLVMTTNQKLSLVNNIDEACAHILYLDNSLLNFTS